MLTTTQLPITATLEHAATRIDDFGASYGDLPIGWRRSADVVSNPDAVRELLDQICAVYGMADRQIAASFLVLGYFWYPMAGAIACYLLDDRVPDLALDSVGVDLRGGVVFTSLRCFGLPGDPDADHPDLTVVADRAALRACMVRQLEEHAAPLFATLRSVAPYGINAMRANYEDRLGSAILWICEQIGDMERAREELPAFIALTREKSRTGIIELEYEGRSGVYLRRGGCCLNYRIPGNEKCDTCCLRPLDERLILLRDYLRAGNPAY